MRTDALHAPRTTSQAAGADSLLQYWFGSGTDDAQVAAAKAALWWRHQPETDAELRSRFGPLTEAAASGELDTWRSTARRRLALILLLDQLPRAICRGTPRAFATDIKARRLALQALDSGLAGELRPIERVFLLLPLEHAEDLACQHLSVARFRGMAADVPERWRTTFDGFADYAVRHRDVIGRFGRFPHRNAILGRPSTPEELRFLEQPGSSF